MILPLYRLVVRMRRTAEYRRVNAMKSQQVKKKKGVEGGKGGVKYVRLYVVYKREKNVGALVCLAV